MPQITYQSVCTYTKITIIWPQRTSINTYVGLHVDIASIHSWVKMGSESQLIGDATSWTSPQWLVPWSNPSR